MTSIPVRALLAGQVLPFGRGEGSAIAKTPLDGPVEIGVLGIVGDEQADQRHHGGPDKALHHYPFDHYARWADLAPDHPLLSAPGAFGENLSTLGLDETTACLGDRFRLGRALIEISQAREPCWKQGDRMAWTTLPKIMVREGRSGWYCRVIEAGTAQAGDLLTLVDRPYPAWSVRRVFDLIIGGKHIDDLIGLKELSENPVLFSGWRDKARRLIGG